MYNFFAPLLKTQEPTINSVGTCKHIDIMPEGDGTWRAKITLPSGKVIYRYFVNGAWQHKKKEPNAIHEKFTKPLYEFT